MKRREIDSCAMQKSEQEYENKEDKWEAVADDKRPVLDLNGDWCASGMVRTHAAFQRSLRRNFMAHDSTGPKDVWTKPGYRGIGMFINWS